MCYLLASYFVSGLKTRSGDVDDSAAQHVATLRCENQRQICTSYTHAVKHNILCFRNCTVRMTQIPNTVVDRAVNLGGGGKTNDFTTII